MYILCVVLRCCALRFRTARLTTSFAPTLKAFTDRGIGSRSRAGYCATGFPCWPEAIEPMMANRPSQNSNKAQEATLTKQNESKCRAKLYGTQTGILSYKLKQHPSGPWQSHLVIFFKGFARMWLIHAWRRELSSQCAPNISTGSTMNLLMDYFAGGSTCLFCGSISVFCLQHINTLGSVSSKTNNARFM